MKTKGVVVLEGHVQGLANTRALGEKGIPVIVVDVCKCVAASSKYCMEFYLCPPFIEDSFADFLIDLGVKRNLDGWLLLPSNDHAVYTLSKHKKNLQEIFNFFVPDFNKIDNIYNKVELLKIARNINIPIPETYCFTDINEKIPQELMFPLITKGKNGLSFYKKIKKKACLTTNEKEFRHLLNHIAGKFELSGTFTQELIPFDGKNKTISFTAFSIDGKIMTYWMGQKLREHPLQFGTATFTESVFIKECLAQSELLIAELNYTGVCEIEYLKDPRNDKYKLIEINPRTWLWVGHAVQCGINYPLYLYNYANGKKETYPSEYEVGVKWRNPISDSIYSLLALLKGKIALSELLNQNKGEIINALWYKGDIKPFFTYLFLMLNYLRNR